MLSLKGIQSQSLEEVKQKLLSMPKKEYDFTVCLATTRIPYFSRQISNHQS